MSNVSNEEVIILSYKKISIALYIILVFSLLSILGQCSSNNKLNLIQQKQIALEEKVLQDGVYVRNLEPVINLSIEKQFTQNLLLNDQLSKKQISTTDIVNKLNDINHKLNKQKKVD